MAAAPAPPATTAPMAGEKVVFNRDVRPILSDTCFKCHGFDAATRKADLRLDTLTGATTDLGGGRGAIVPGDPEESEAYRRIASDDPDEQMPPPESGLTLSKEQKELLRRWIEQGAEYQPHWSFIPPADVALPEVKDAEWVGNPIDRFILAKLEQESLAPSTEADKVTLIRRVTLDLTGLPPTPAEVDAFLADQSPRAYERVVDRLLASQRYGERMAMRWLDLARYADTNGYQVDTDRVMYRWRDWVIEAFNSNQPFDQFTIEQLAGDLIPSATLEQKIASGFNRNHRITLEGGSIPEEYRVEYVLDRVETTATTWLAMTMGCARCHDHKYDPVSQKEFYQFFAFFNHVPDNGIDGGNGNSVPFIPAPLEPERTKLEKADKEVAAAAAVVKELEPKIADAQQQWEKSLQNERLPATLKNGLIAHYPLDGHTLDIAAPARTGVVRLNVAQYADGIFDKAFDFDGRRWIELGAVGRFERTDAFSFGAWVYTRDDTDAAIIGRINESKGTTGYNLFAQGRVLHTQLISKVPDNMITFVSGPVLTSNTWHHVFATYDGSSKAAGVKTYLDGKPLAMTLGSDTLTGSIVTQVPLRIGGRSGGTRFSGKVDEVRIYNRVLTPEEVKALGGAHVIAKQVAPDKRTPDQVATIRAAYLETAAPKEIKEPVDKLAAVTNQRSELLKGIPTVMVMSDAAPRETFILKRGQYDQPGEKVTAGVPAALPAMKKDAPANRLGLAQWLVDEKHPLTARVAVNRFWEMYFGTGIVKSTEDFGSQSEWPTHPELLDWLAETFIRSGWDVKAMQKLIVTSATYRQSSRVTKELLEKDPANKLLARGPRLRLSAESIRDQALLASGLLVEKVGGPSVKPYQPPGLWEDITSGGLTKYVQDTGEALYRRSMYTFWKRTVPPPGMSVFDAPSREICTVNRSRTNTPLQALALMNDIVYVEAARKLAERAMNEGGLKPAERITHAFRLAVSRKPTEAELAVLVEGFKHHLGTYFNDPEAAEKFTTVGESKRNSNLDARELAAYTAVASVILNMDQTITRE